MVTGVDLRDTGELVGMRYERVKDIVDLAIRLQASRGGVTLNDIQKELSVSRRTAERMRDTVEWAFGPLETVQADDNKLHWRLSSGFIEYVGQERITTVAGDFDAHHYRFPPKPDRPLHLSGTPLSEDVWVTHPDYMFVRAEVHGYLRNPSGFGRYELVELDT